MSIIPTWRIRKNTWKNVWNNLSISVRVIFIVMLPAILMLGIIVVSTYFTRLAEVNEELAERGRVIASALAESSEYGVISGNITDLQRITKSLVEADSSISQIDIVDAHKNLLLHVTSKENRLAEQRVFEAPIIKQNIVAGKACINHFSVYISAP